MAETKTKQTATAGEPSKTTDKKSPKQSTAASDTKKQVTVKKNSDKPVARVIPEYKPELPDLKEFFKAGIQFGHETRRWNPKMSEYIFGEKGNIHIIDIAQTIEKLTEALKFVYLAAARGEVLMVGTKRQASDIVKNAAIESGSYYVINRWPGGLLTNFNQIKKSLKKFNQLEQDLEHGVEGRTKFEISNMKKEWIKMNRLYEGIKTMERYPQAVVVIDKKFERNAIMEANNVGVPVISLVDTNSDPDDVQYPIPANDDAIRSIKLITGLIADAVKAGNKGKGVKHDLKDFSRVEVKIIRKEEEKSPQEEVELAKVVKATSDKPEGKSVKKETSRGMLENIQKQRELKKVAKATDEREKTK